MVNEGTGSRPSPQMGRNGIHVLVAPTMAGKGGLLGLECPAGRSKAVESLEIHHDGEQRGARVNRIVDAVWAILSLQARQGTSQGSTGMIVRTQRSFRKKTRILGATKRRSGRVQFGNVNVQRSGPSSLHLPG